MAKAKFNIRWFQVASYLWFRKLPLRVVLNRTGEEVVILSWRRTFFGPALKIQFDDGRIEHGYDLATVRFR